MSRILMTLAALTLAGSGAMAQSPQIAAVPAQKPPDTSVATAAPRTPPQLVNIRLELTITDQRDGSPATARTLTMLLGDRESGRLRTGQPQVNAKLDVDARPEILGNGRIRVLLTLDYRPQAAEADKVQPSTVSESLTSLLEDGKPLVVSQSADPTTTRAAVKVELKATVLR